MCHHKNDATDLNIHAYMNLSELCYYFAILIGSDHSCDSRIDTLMKLTLVFSTHCIYQNSSCLDSLSQVIAKSAHIADRLIN